MPVKIKTTSKIIKITYLNIEYNSWQNRKHIENPIINRYEIVISRIDIIEDLITNCNHLNANE